MTNIMTLIFMFSQGYKTYINYENENGIFKSLK
jgi:hypothetical protein